MSPKRLFVALTFGEEVEHTLYQGVELLRHHSVKGAFTRRENLHLTLEFLGETPHEQAVRKAMEEVRSPPFALEIGGLGRFRRNGGDIWWIGVEQAPELLELHRSLQSALGRNGFAPEKRPYRPHLTLGRRVVLQPGTDLIQLERMMPSIGVPCRSITLMWSHRENGVLTYTPIWETALQ